MITHLKSKISNASPAEFNRVLRLVARSAWVGSGALFICYLYLVGSLTFSIVKQREIEQTNKMALSKMSREELDYLVSQKELTLAAAHASGLVEADTISFASGARAFAWNVGH